MFNGIAVVKKFLGKIVYFFVYVFRAVLKTFESEPMEIRAWSIFFDTTKIKLPENGEKVKERVGNNVTYFVGNYALLLGITFAIGVYQELSISFAFTLMVIALGGLYFLNNPLPTFHNIPKETAILWGGVLSVLVIFYMIGWVFKISFLVVILHAILYRSTIRKKLTNVVNKLKSEESIDGVGDVLLDETSNIFKKLSNKFN
jgi:hypothetical protein